MEYIDILNDKGEITGKIATREEVHKYGYLHRAIQVLIINSKNEVLIQRRSPNKEKHPNLWDVSCAGHLSSGDTSIEGTMRELKEELGIKPNKEKLKLIQTVQKSYIPKPGFKENEIQDIYLYEENIDIKSIKMQKEEVSEVKYIPFKLFAKKISEEDKEFVPRKREYKEVIEIINKELENS